MDPPVLTDINAAKDSAPVARYSLRPTPNFPRCDQPPTRFLRLLFARYPAVTQVTIRRKDVLQDGDALRAVSTLKPASSRAASQVAIDIATTCTNSNANFPRTPSIDLLNAQQALPPRCSEEGAASCAGDAAENADCPQAARTIRPTTMSRGRGNEAVVLIACSRAEDEKNGCKHSLRPSNPA